MAKVVGRTKQEWISLAEHRIGNILRVRRICSESQFEAKISEAGLETDRPEPGVLAEARKTLLELGEIKKVRFAGLDVTFFSLASFDISRERKRCNRIRRAYKIYNSVSQGDSNLCGKVAEKVIYEAIFSASSMHIFGGIDEKDKVKCFNGKRILDDKTLDFVLCDKGSGIPLGVEVKNRRRWYHRRSRDMWESLAKCVSIGVLPVFICRRFVYLLPTRVFSVVGCFGYQLYKQCFHPSTEKKLSDVRHKDGLGFADIVFPEEIDGRFATEPRYIKYFKESIPRHIEDYYERYQTLLPVLAEYLVEKRFWEDPWDEALFIEFMAEVFEWFEENAGP